MEFGTSAPAGSTPVLTIELLPQDAVELLADIDPGEYTTTATARTVRLELTEFIRAHA
jgi:hypothetical protein